MDGVVRPDRGARPPGAPDRAAPRGSRLRRRAPAGRRRPRRRPASRRRGLDGARPGRVGEHGQDDGPSPGDERGEPSGGEARGVGEQLAHALAAAARASAARSSGLAPTSRIRGGHGTSSGGAGTTDGGRRRLISPAAARLTAPAGACRGPAGRRSGPGRRSSAPGGRAGAPRRRPASAAGVNAARGGERDDADPVAADVEQPPGRASGRLGPDDDRRRLAQDPRPQPLAEAGDRSALVPARQLPRREVEQGHDHRQPRGERRRAAGRVIDGADAPPRSARQAVPRTRPQQERVDRQRAGPQEPGRRQQPATDDVEVLRAGAAVGSSSRPGAGARTTRRGGSAA